MFNSRLVIHSRGGLKMVEVILAVVCLVLLRKFDLTFGGEANDINRQMVGMITLGGMLMVSAPLLLAYLRITYLSSGVEDQYAPFLESIYNFLGFVLYLTVGCLVLTYYSDNKSSVSISNTKAGIALGAISILNAVIYLADAGLAVQALDI